MEGSGAAQYNKRSKRFLKVLFCNVRSAVIILFTHQLHACVMKQWGV